MARTTCRAVLWGLALLLASGRAPATEAAKIQVADVNGATVAPLAGQGRKATALFFITNDCPISNSYAPEINRICAAYTPKKVAFYMVYVDPDLSAAAAKRHAKAYGFRCPALLDSKHQLVRLTQATLTPEVAVLSPDGKLRYRGRIDDLYYDFGKRRDQPTTHDLRDALDALLHAKSVPHATTQAIGCFIPATKQEEMRR